MKNGPGAQRDRAFDRVFQFTHVPGPFIGGQPCQGVLGQRQRRASWNREFFEERLRQYGNIPLALAQRRELDLDNIQAEKKILPKLARANCRFEILICGGNHPHFDRHTVIRSDWLDFVFLQDTQ